MDEKFAMSINHQIKNYMIEHREFLSRGDETKALCFHGVVDELTYLKQVHKICFLLKETNITDPSKKKDWDYANWLNYNQLRGEKREKDDKETLYKTYHNVCMWVAMFYDLLSEKDVQYANYTYTETDDGALNLNKIKGELAKVAFVNLKKTWGGPYTQWKDLNRYIKDKIDNQWSVNPEIQATLNFEMSLINPQIVICGSQVVYDFARSIFCVDKEMAEITQTDAFQSNGVLFVNFRHPACRGSRKNQFEYAKKIFNEIAMIIKE